MIYDNKILGEDLKKELESGYNIVRISRWAHEQFLKHRRFLKPSTSDVLRSLFSMEDDPQFEFSEAELRMLAEKLIAGSEDPLKELSGL